MKLNIIIIILILALLGLAINAMGVNKLVGIIPEVVPMNYTYELTLIKEGIKDQELIRLFNLADNNDTITLHINSDGGTVFKGMQILNALKHTKAQVTGIVNIRAFSMGATLAASIEDIHFVEHSALIFHVTQKCRHECVPARGAYVEDINMSVTRAVSRFLTAAELHTMLVDEEDVYISGEELYLRLLAGKEPVSETDIAAIFHLRLTEFYDSKGPQ